MKNIIIIMLMLIGFTASAQEKKITGAVTDEGGLPLPGVTVQIKGTQRGVQTDFDGNFSITTNPTESLIFSFVGMYTVEQIVGDQKEFIVCLKEDTVTLAKVEILPYPRTIKPKVGIQIITVKEIETPTSK